MQKHAHVGIATAWLIAAVVVSGLSFVADYFVGVEKLGLFARSGALVALAAVVLEYQLSMGSYLRHVYKRGMPISMLHLAEAFNLPDKERRLRAFAHSLLAVGTLIWAYGDLIFRFL